MDMKEQFKGLAAKFKISPKLEASVQDGVIEFYVRELDGLRDGRLNARNFRREGDKSVLVDDGMYTTRWAAAAMCDEAGAYLWTEADESTLAQWPATVLDKIQAEAWKLNGATVADEKKGLPAIPNAAESSK